MAEIVLDAVSKEYADGTLAVSDLNLDIEDGEFVVLVGPSGCGKTTALRMIAGLESISGGTLSIDDRVVNGVPPKERDIAMVFQNYALYPHMTVYDNMAFGLKLRKLPKEEIDRRVREAGRHPRARGPAATQAEGVVGRSAAAGGHGSRDRPRAQGVPDGRTAVQPRCQAARADAHRDRADPARAERHHDLRHARPGRGDDHGRPRGRDPQGEAAAGGHPAAPVRPPREPLRGRLHRLARHEHGGGQDLHVERRRDRGVRWADAVGAARGRGLARRPRAVRGTDRRRGAAARGHRGCDARSRGTRGSPDPRDHRPAGVTRRGRRGALHGRRAGRGHRGHEGTRARCRARQARVRGARSMRSTRSSWPG